jgi:predicted glycosyltransferase
MKPVLYLYCQHSVGMGHFVRSLALSRALGQVFDVHFLNGGRAPEGLPLPVGVKFHHLAPLGMDAEAQLVSLDPNLTVEQAQRQRTSYITDLFVQHPPDVVITELYPFGRKKFAFELAPLLRAARARDAVIVCSVRDLLVSQRRDQQRHDDRTAVQLDAEFDAVIVHADPRFAKLEESFRPTQPPRTPIFYSGFVTPHGIGAPANARENRVLVSAGGGLVGGPLFRAALAMQAQSFAHTQRPMTIVAGPFLPEADWLELCQDAGDVAGLTTLRAVPDLGALMQASSHSISQCGYNTAMDILVSGVAALVVPYVTASENEQSVRAARLAALDCVGVVDAAALSAETLAAGLERLASQPGSACAFALDGARNTVRIVDELLRDRGYGKRRLAGRSL